jgi:hypothetical protein
VAISIALGATPYVGDANDWIAGMTGCSIIEAVCGLSYEERALYLAAAFIPVASGAMLRNAAKAARFSDEVVQAVGAAKRLTYQASPYHGTVAVGAKSAGPLNGQAALDVSIQVSATSPRRVGVDYGAQQFVVLDQTQVGVFHGHVRTWSELTTKMQHTLAEAGMADRRGNILLGSGR